MHMLYSSFVVIADNVEPEEAALLFHVVVNPLILLYAGGIRQVTSSFAAADAHDEIG